MKSPIKEIDFKAQLNMDLKLENQDSSDQKRKSHLQAQKEIQEKLQQYNQMNPAGKTR